MAKTVLAEQVNGNQLGKHTPVIVFEVVTFFRTQCELMKYIQCSKVRSGDAVGVVGEDRGLASNFAGGAPGCVAWRPECTAALPREEWLSLAGWYRMANNPVSMKTACR